MMQDLIIPGETLTFIIGLFCGGFIGLILGTYIERRILK